MAWWMIGAALGQSPGVVQLEASPEAEVVVFPRVDERRIDVGVYGNRVPLDEQLEGLTTQHLDSGWATSIGGGTWFVTLHVDPGVELAVERTPQEIELRLAPGRPEVVRPPQPPSLDDLLDDPPPRRPAEPVPLTLHPLRGDASTLQMDPVEAFRFMPKVVTPHVATYRSSLAAIDTYRGVLTRTDRGEVRAAALARIGVAMSKLDLHRDALHYLRRALEEGRDDAPVALVAARSHVALGQAEEARSLCRYAARRGGRDEDVLACLAGVAGIDDRLPKSELGRALAEASRHPHRRLLAAQLLAADHRPAEARTILEALLESGGPEVFSVYGDVLQATGDLPAAMDAWRAASRSRRLQPRMTLRMRMAEWVQEGPQGFAAAIPQLLQLGDGAGLVAAEAHYLLAQIAQVYGDTDIAAEQLNLLWNHHPRLALGSDVPERLVATCAFRLRQLAEQQRPVDLVAFHDLCWRDELDEMTVRPEPLQLTSLALAELGLMDEALSLQLRAVAMCTRVGEDDPDALTWLAELYHRTGRHHEALDTITFVEGLPQVPEELTDRMELVRGDAQLALGRPEAALAAWEGVDDPEAARRRGLYLARAQRCDEALPLLEPLTGPPIALAEARCLLRLGRPDAAVARLDEVDEADEPSQRDVAWLASVAAFQGAGDVGTGLWQELLAEERANAAWEARRRGR